MIEWLSEILVGATVCGTIGSGFGAMFRNRPVVGFLLGFFVGPLGWLCLVAVEDQRPKCPDCGGVIVKGAKRCKNCGVIFRQPRMSRPSPYEQAENDDDADEVMDWLNS